MDLKTSILVQILADTDALFLPNRSWNFTKPTNLFFGRRRYGKEGVVWASGRKTAAERKAAQRALEALAKEGLVTIFRANNTKTTGVKLTDEGEARARELCGLPSLANSWWACDALTMHSKPPGEAKTYDDVWVSEEKLSRVPHPGEGKDQTAFLREINLIEDEFLPALSRGWVVATSTVHRNVFYALTQTGWDILKGDWPEDRPEVEVNREIRRAYLDRIEEQLDRLEHARPENPNEIGMLPLPDSMKNLPLKKTPVALVSLVLDSAVA